MPAANIATLYDFETAYEDALKNYFVNVNIGGFLFSQVLTPRTNINVADWQKTPRLQIKAGIQGLAESGSGTPEISVTLNNVATNYYAYYTLGIALDVVTSRSNASQPHGLYRGATRQGMLEYTATMNNTSVPNYQTVFVNPQSSVQAIDEDNDEIITQLLYSIDFFIPPASFPNS